MNDGSLIWMVVFAIAAAVFFGIAAIVAVKGFGDLKDLLRRSDRRSET